MLHFHHLCERLHGLLQDLHYVRSWGGVVVSCQDLSLYTPLLLASHARKQVGVAAWLECWLSHLGVAGLSPGRDNL